MYNYYLLNSAYVGIGKDRFLSNMEQLLEVLNNDDMYDHYYYSNQWWNVVVEESPLLKISTASMSCNQHFARMVLPRMMQKFKGCELIEDKTGLDEHFKGKNNAFWGVNFDSEGDYYLSTKEDYNKFREVTKLNYINFQNLLDYQSLLFKHIKFCSKAEHEMRNLGSIYDMQLIKDLVQVDSIYGLCKDVAKSFIEVAKEHGIDVSRESETVDNNPHMRSERTYKIPCLEKPKYCPIHIKLGTKKDPIRVYVYLDTIKYNLYVCEICGHKSTAKY